MKNTIRNNPYPFARPQSYRSAVGSVPEMTRHDPVRYGAYLAGPPLAPPIAIAYDARLSEPDLDALVAYLRSLPPVESDH